MKPDIAREIWDAHVAVVPDISENERERRLTLVLNELWERGVVLVPATDTFKNHALIFIAGVAIGMILMLAIAAIIPGEII